MGKALQVAGAAMLRALLHAAYRGQRVWRLATRPHLRGVVAVALTPAGRIVLVRHRYNRGWHLPGGHVDAGEAPEVAIRRELDEELGVRGAAAPVLLETVRLRSNGATYDTAVYLVRDVTYRPPPFSLEIAEVAEFAPAAVPADARLGEHAARAILARHGL